jgi:uncharacterized protein (DUF1778 family)
MRFSAAMIDNIRFRVSPAEKRALAAAAARQGKTLSEFLRDAVSETAQRVGA